MLNPTRLFLPTSHLWFPGMAINPLGRFGVCGSCCGGWNCGPGYKPGVPHEWDDSFSSGDTSNYTATHPHWMVWLGEADRAGISDGKLVFSVEYDPYGYAYETLLVLTARPRTNHGIFYQFEVDVEPPVLPTWLPWPSSPAATIGLMWNHVGGVGNFHLHYDRTGFVGYQAIDYCDWSPLFPTPQGFHLKFVLEDVSGAQDGSIQRRRYYVDDHLLKETTAMVGGCLTPGFDDYPSECVQVGLNAAATGFVEPWRVSFDNFHLETGAW